MADPIFMRVGEGRTVELPVFVGAMSNFLGLLREFDSTIAERKTGNLRWKVTTLSESPSPLVGVTPFMRKASNDTGERVERELISNVAALTERGERNKFLSDAAINRVERIAKTTPSIGPSALYIGSKGGLTVETTVNVQTLKQVEDLTIVKSTSYGAISGVLGSISVRRGYEFRVWDEQTNRPVRCVFDKRREAQVKDLLGTKVAVTGMVKADRHGRPISMFIEDFGPQRVPQPLPTIAEMRGAIPNFTGGLSLAEFFEDFD